MSELEASEGFSPTGGISEEGLSASSPRAGMYRLVPFHSDQICGARVGSGGLVCIKFKDACKVKVHKVAKNRCELSVGQYYGLCKVSETQKDPAAVLSDFFIRSDLLPPPLLYEWNQANAPAEERAFRFQALTSNREILLMTPDKIKEKRLESQEATRSILDDEDTDVSGSWAAVDWIFSPSRTQPLLKLDYEQELFDS